MNKYKNYSVLMSLYFKENPEYLCQSIESMLHQTVKSNDIVIVKDGPLTEELEKILSEYKIKYENIINIVDSKENIGLGEALNLGLQHCKNELVARMDTDDISLAERCEKQLKVFNENNDFSIVGTCIDEFIDKEDEIISTRVVPEKQSDIYRFAKRRSPFNHPTVMYKKSDVLQVGGYSNLRRNQDVDLFGRMLFRGSIAYNIQESLLLFRSNRELSKRRRSWINTKSYIKTIYNLKKIGYSSWGDVFVVMLGQIIMFICPIKIQNLLYKKFLRK